MYVCVDDFNQLIYSNDFLLVYFKNHKNTQICM